MSGASALMKAEEPKAKGKQGADKFSAKQYEFFEKQVRPVLVNRCYDCHSEDSVESELRLDSLAYMLAGGTRGPAIVIGDPKKSLLVSAINHSDSLQMPPKEKLPRREIVVLTEWIRRGAAWPNSKPIVQAEKSGKTGEIFSGRGSPVAVLLTGQVMVKRRIG
ncbi:MAG: hypothetical protein IIA65_06675 [Planctomycetes bacterium]|nr:hypothetical protein [Planctomycetota bacterium]